MSFAQLAHQRWFAKFAFHLKNEAFGLTDAHIEAAKTMTSEDLGYSLWDDKTETDTHAVKVDNDYNDDNTDNADNDKGSKRSINQIDPANPADPVAFVDAKIRSGAWKLSVAESMRTHSGKYANRDPDVIIMEFVVDNKEKTTYKFQQVIKSAGYNHFNLFDKVGWVPFLLENDQKGFGRPVTSPTRIRNFQDNKKFNTPTPRDDGDGWTFRGNNFPASHWPHANLWGPRGSTGPRWGSNYTGD